MNRRVIPKHIRKQVYEKYGGHCAYCGKSLEYKEMQVDHLIPFRKIENAPAQDVEQIENVENYMPACRSCNHYKRGADLEVFRNLIETIPDKLERDNYIYRIGCRYKNIKPEKQKIIFYFERDNDEWED